LHIILNIYYAAISIKDIVCLLLISVSVIDENKVGMLVGEKVGWLCYASCKRCNVYKFKQF